MFKLAVISCIFLIVGCPYESMAESPIKNSPESQLEDLETRSNDLYPQTMQPFRDYIQANQNLWSTCKEIIGTGCQAKVDQMKLQMDAIEKSFSDVKTSLLSLIKLIPSDLDERLARIEDQSAVRNQLNPLGIQQATLHDDMFKIYASQHFEKIGSKFFYIENINKLNWTAAASMCLKMGGQLAEINDVHEWNALNQRVYDTASYWLGISDQAAEGVFVSLISGKPAPFLKWEAGEPDNDGIANCVAFYNSKMYDDQCSLLRNYICQANV